MIKLMTSVKSIWKGKLISEIPYEIIMPPEFLPDLAQSVRSLKCIETNNDLTYSMDIKAKVWMKVYSYNPNKTNELQSQQCDGKRQDDESTLDDRTQKIETTPNNMKKDLKSKPPIGKFCIDFDILDANPENLETFHEGQERSLFAETIAFQKIFAHGEMLCEGDSSNDWKWISKYVPAKFQMLINVHQDIYYEEPYVAFFVAMETHLKHYGNHKSSLHHDHYGSVSTKDATQIQLMKKDGYMPTHDTFKYSGYTLPLTVTEYALVIEERFIDNPYVCHLPDLGPMTFAWYSKCGGEHAGLDVTIHIKNAKGKIHNCFTSTVKLKTELIYSDGSNAPLMPNSPLKERRNTRSSKTLLFNPLRPSPIFQPEDGSQSFSFRIEEVSFHHPGQTGFKLKVSVANMDSLSRWMDDTSPDFYVHPGILDEIIIVRSKPKLDNDGMKMRLHGGRSPRRRESFLKRLNQNHSKKRSYLPTINSLGKSHETYEQYSILSCLPPSTFENEIESNCFSMSWNLFINHFVRTNHQKCLWCGVHMSSMNAVVDCNTHIPGCYFASVLLPSIHTTTENIHVYDDKKESCGDEIEHEYCFAHSQPHYNQNLNKQSIGHIFDEHGNIISLPFDFYNDENTASNDASSHSRNKVSILGFTDDNVDIDFIDEINLNALELYDANIDDGAHLVTVFEDYQGL